MNKSVSGSMQVIRESYKSLERWQSKTGQRILIVGGLALCVMMYGLWDKQSREIILISLAETYVSVTAFVATTLMLLLAIERLSGFNAANFMEKSKRWELPMASFLGAMPGCGGALVVVTQYVNGTLSFGALIAVLTATMGDAAFLILAKEPKTGVILIISTFFIGWVSGVVVNAVHGKNFMRKKGPMHSKSLNNGEGGKHNRSMLFAGNPWRVWIDRIWLMSLIPGIVCASLYAFQVNILTLYLWGVPILHIFSIFVVLCIIYWVLFSGPTGRETSKRETQNLTLRSVIDDTNFVTVWVVAAFLLFNLTIHIFTIDLVSAFGAAYIFLPIIAIVIGFIPGCGPQILVAATYISGLVPFSALMGNAISNDGDALFPALALAPRAAMVATLYSAIPAIAVSYTLLFLGH